MNQGVLNSYCWMYSNFNIPPSFQVRSFIRDKVTELILTQGNCYKREHDGNTLYNSYYQVY